MRIGVEERPEVARARCRSGRWCRRAAVTIWRRRASSVRRGARGPRAAVVSIQVEMRAGQRRVRPCAVARVEDIGRVVDVDDVIDHRANAYSACTAGRRSGGSSRGRQDSTCARARRRSADSSGRPRRDRRLGGRASGRPIGLPGAAHRSCSTAAPVYRAGVRRGRTQTQRIDGPQRHRRDHGGERRQRDVPEVVQPDRPVRLEHQHQPGADAHQPHQRRGRQREPGGQRQRPRVVPGQRGGREDHDRDERDEDAHARPRVRCGGTATTSQTSSTDQGDLRTASG